MNRFLIPLSLVLWPACATAQQNMSPVAWQPRQVQIVGPMTPESIVMPIVILQSAIAAHDPSIKVLINSPGGLNVAGSQLLSALKRARVAGVRIDCRVDGQASSFAAVLFEAGCSTRAMAPGSYLLFHESFFTELPPGKKTLSDLHAFTDNLEDENRRVAALCAWRLHMSADQYLAWVKGRDRYLDAPAALKMGATDTAE